MNHIGHNQDVGLAIHRRSLVQGPCRSTRVERGLILRDILAPIIVVSKAKWLSPGVATQDVKLASHSDFTCEHHLTYTN
jgi:hypothetical protein